MAKHSTIRITYYLSKMCVKTLKCVLKTKLKSDSMCTCNFYLVRPLNGLLWVPLSWNNVGCGVYHEIIWKLCRTWISFWSQQISSLIRSTTVPWNFQNRHSFMWQRLHLPLWLRRAIVPGIVSISWIPPTTFLAPSMALCAPPNGGNLTCKIPIYHLFGKSVLDFK